MNLHIAQLLDDPCDAAATPAGAPERAGIAAPAASPLSPRRHREPSVADVRDLIDAAGPLAPRDVAAGLGAPSPATRGVVAWMLRHGRLREDEWGRVALRCV